MPSRAVIVAVVVAAAALLAHAQSPPVLDVVHVPLTFSQDSQRYLANVNMSVVNTQRFSFALSTTTGNTLVANSSCTSCQSLNIPTYNATQSTTAVQVQNGTRQQSISIADGAADAGSGILSQENCALAQANGSFWQYPKQPIVQAASSSVFQPGVSGLVGLGTSDFNNTIFNGWFARNPLQHNFTFGLALAPPPNSFQATLPSADPEDASATAGTLHMMQTDDLAHSGPIAWYDVPNNGSASAAAAAWALQLDGWNFSAGAAQSSNSAGGPATLEPFFASLFLPRAQAAQLYAAVPGATPLPAQSEQQNAAFAVPCDANLTFSVLVAAQPYPVPPDALVLRAPDGSCLGAIEGWADPARTDYLLGSRFISAYYVAFQVGRPPDTTQKIGLAPRALAPPPSPHGPNVGAIVGGVIGGVAFVLLLFALLFWCLRKRTHAQTPPPPVPAIFEKPPVTIIPLAAATPEPRTTPDPFYPPPTASSPPTSPPSGNESFPLLLSPSSPRVTQWVRPTAAGERRYDVPPAHYDVPPAHYDYGNCGEPGTPY